QLTPRRDHDRFAFFTQKVNAAVGVDWRRRVVAAEPRTPEFLARLRVDARGDAVVADDVQLVTDKQRRRRPRNPAVELPNDLRLRYVAAPVEPHRQQRRLLKSRTNKDEIVAVHRHRYV